MKKIYKEKGFTLIELLATIVILLLIFTIGFAVISNLLNSSNDTIDDVTKKMIIKAAEQYAIEYRNEESWVEEKDDDGNTILCITLESLINSGYFGANQSKVMEYKNDGWTVKITINNGIYNSEIITSEIADNVCKNFNGKVVYTINYDANGGEWYPESQTKNHNKELTLRSDIPEREGYNFVGWSTSSSATSATYNPGDTYTANSSATLYAVWEKIAYTVKYYANGGSGQPSTQTKFYDTALKLSSTIPQRAGYEFLGWSTSSDALSATYSPGQTYTNNAHIDLYAVWKKIIYTISYNVNGGSGQLASQTKNYGINLTLSDIIPNREGHIFLGWSTSSSATSATYNPGDTYTANSSATLYAVWEKIAYTVKYYANGGSGQPSTQTKFYDTALKLSSTIPQRAGYEFLGWSTSSDALSATYSPGQTYTNNAHIDLYAVWKKIIYTISYNVNGGSGQPASQTKNYGVNILLSNTVPKRAGYLFLGWSTGSNATSATYTPGDTYTANSSATLYAVWKAVPVGSYISYTAGGYSSWRVMYNNNGQLDIISTGSVGNRSLANEDGYKNGVGYLNLWAKEYINSEYATTARCLGYSSATQEYVTATFDYDSTGFPHEDSNYQADVNQLINYGLVQTDTTVFLASRTIEGYRDNIFTGDFGTQGRIRTLLTSGEVDSEWLHESAYNHSYDDNRTRTYGLRPVVSLVSGLYVVSGDGTSEATAYVLSK